MHNYIFLNGKKRLKPNKTSSRLNTMIKILEDYEHFLDVLSSIYNADQ